MDYNIWHKKQQLRLSRNTQDSASTIQETNGLNNSAVLAVPQYINSGRKNLSKFQMYKNSPNSEFTFYCYFCEDCQIEISDCSCTRSTYHDGGYKSFTPFHQTEKCPKCHRPISHKDGYYYSTRRCPPRMGWYLNINTSEFKKYETQYYGNRLANIEFENGEGKWVIINTRDWCCYSNVFAYMECLRDIEEKNIEQKNEQIAQQLLDEMVKGICDSEIAGQSQLSVEHKSYDTDNLKNYLMHLINVESDIYATEQRLKTLFAVREKIYRDNKAKAEAAIKDAQQASIKKQRWLRQNLTRAQKALDEYQDDITPFPERMPIKPTAPSEPFLETPGLFNRKKNTSYK